MLSLTTVHRRGLFAAIALFVVTLLVVAWQLQYGPEKQQPCPLCILQRYVYMGIVAFALFGAVQSRMHAWAAMGASSLATVGMGLSVWQLAKGSEMTTCRTDPVGVFVNELPMAMWWPDYLFATGGCADKYPPLFGVSIPAWSLICFTVISTLTAIMFVVALRPEKVSR